MSLNRTYEWFQEAIPTPTKSLQKVQLGVHLEEFAEMLNEMTIAGHEELIAKAKQSVETLATLLKTDKNITLTITNRKDFLDALIDQLVTLTGTAYQQGMDILGGLDEVNDSNFSKFKDGKAIFDSNGKIAKNPETYRKADLSTFVGIDATELENPL